MNDVKKKTNSEEVLNHWLGFADEFTLAPQEFYAAVERELETLKIPGLEISREEHAEGGLLSAKRVYFRMPGYPIDATDPQDAAARSQITPKICGEYHRKHNFSIWWRQ
jgi:hypothetical protein